MTISVMITYKLSLSRIMSQGSRVFLLVHIFRRTALCYLPENSAVLSSGEQRCAIFRRTALCYLPENSCAIFRRTALCYLPENSAVLSSGEQRCAIFRRTAVLSSGEQLCYLPENSAVLSSGEQLCYLPENSCAIFRRTALCYLPENSCAIFRRTAVLSSGEQLCYLPENSCANQAAMLWGWRAETVGLYSLVHETLAPVPQAVVHKHSIRNVTIFFSSSYLIVSLRLSFSHKIFDFLSL